MLSIKGMYSGELGREDLSIVDAHNLTYTYPASEAPAITGIDFKVQRGELVVLTGPSGCGKTTLCRCFNGLIPNFYGGELQGELTVHGLSVKEHSTSELSQHVGFVFQNPENQLFALSVEKDIAFGLENLAVPREEMQRRVDWAMDIVGIRDLKDAAPFELSGGQQQRVAIASVLAMQPDLVVLDEPTSFLDPVAAKNLFEIISRLNKDLNLATILVEHRLDLLSTYASRLIVMDKGTIVAEGLPREVLMSKNVESLGIGIPKVTRLFQMLSEQGIVLGQPVVSVEELANEIRKWLVK
ncbi:ATP-binding cassette domain-containing protein [Candidatus Bathyarchaeota archaeon]|nr:ATP-binding cassette domain-containing protein [Candidatus Bathyarchaeota archaeon]